MSLENTEGEVGEMKEALTKDNKEKLQQSKFLYKLSTLGYLGMNRFGIESFSAALFFSFYGCVAVTAKDKI